MYRCPVGLPLNEVHGVFARATQLIGAYRAAATKGKMGLLVHCLGEFGANAYSFGQRRPA